MLNTVLSNLITNAIKYTPKNGTVKISVSTIANHVKISIVDSGVGIERTKLDNLFKINEVTSTPGTDKEKGTGLGLILCKEFVEKHGGKIGVESEIGKGSNFWCLLPIGETQNI